MRLSGDNILVVGDRDRRMQSAVAGALPAASITSVRTVFDAIAELHAGLYHGVLVNTDPLESRPEAATRALREAAGEGRIVLWTEATHEPFTRKLIDQGADDYVVAPADAAELKQTLTGPPEAVPAVVAQPEIAAAVESSSNEPLKALLELPLTDIVLSAMLEHPQRAVAFAVDAINQRLSGVITLRLHPDAEPVFAEEPGRRVLTHPIRSDTPSGLSLSIDLPDTVEELAAQHALAHLCTVLGKVRLIDDRQGRLQKLAITDELTGLSNNRYFKHFLSRMIEKAKAKRFPVTLLLFDIDNFKKYNDTFGHGVGDEILKQTASLMKRTTRDHDLVARISGDEFAVVFWEKEGPRQAYEPSQSGGRLPSTPMQIAQRFRKLLSNKDFTEFSLLGPAGKGILTISGGMAVFPYDGRTPEELIEAADRALMFGAKKAEKTASTSSAKKTPSTSSSKILEGGFGGRQSLPPFPSICRSVTE
ncbi:MAG: GGDEF domain-containing protein [Tepidisphaeraceae bacterium]